MTVDLLHDSLDNSGTSTSSVIERGRDSVTPVEDTEPGHAMPDEAWFDDPDTHFEEVRDYMRRLHRRCSSSVEFIAALSGLFPDLEEKVARISAGAEIDFGSYDEADAVAELGPGRYVCFRSAAKLTALDLAQIAGPDRRGAGDQPDEAWFEDPDAHYDEVVYYIKRLHVRCDSSDEFVAALSGLFPDLKERVDKSRALAVEDLGDDDLPDPDADIAEGRSVTFLSGAEMLAADLAMLSDPVVCD